MMKCLERFNSKMKYSGESLRNEHIKSSIELLKETFYDDASLSLGIYFWEHGLKDYDERNTVDIRLYSRAFSNANGSTVKFQTLIDTPVVTGDVLYDSISDEYYLCTESFNIDGIHWQGKLTLCNWMLKWQNKNGEILEYPCHDINSTQYNSGEQANQQFTIGSSQHMVTLPCDENTVRLNTPQRFFLDKNLENPTSFIVTQNDTTSYNYGKKGLVKVTLLEHVGNSATDRIDLGICDYFDPYENKKNNATNKVVEKSVISYKTKTIKSGGDSQVFVGKFFDSNENELVDIVPKWSIICDFIDALEIEESGDRISIGIDNDEYVDEEFKLILSDSKNNYVSSILVKIDSLL